MTDRPRSEVRATFSDSGRITLLEDDMDGLYTKISSMQRILMGVLVSLVTASLLLAVNAIILGSK